MLLIKISDWAMSVKGLLRLVSALSYPRMDSSGMLAPTQKLTARLLYSPRAPITIARVG